MRGEQSWKQAQTGRKEGRKEGGRKEGSTEKLQKEKKDTYHTRVQYSKDCQPERRRSLREKRRMEIREKDERIGKRQRNIVIDE